MHWVLLAALLVAAGIPGCLDEPTPAEGEPVPDIVLPGPEPPPPIDENATMPMSLGPGASGDVPGVIDTTSPACGWSTTVCHRYKFSLHGPTDVTVDLVWDDPGADLDLSIVNGGESGHGLAFGNGSGSEETLSANLDSGTYDIVVLGYLSVDTPYHVQAAFEETS